jgi:hypothetical protein
MLFILLSTKSFLPNLAQGGGEPHVGDILKKSEWRGAEGYAWYVEVNGRYGAWFHHDDVREKDKIMNIVTGYCDYCDNIDQVVMLLPMDIEDATWICYKCLKNYQSAISFWKKMHLNSHKPDYSN